MSEEESVYYEKGPVKITSRRAILGQNTYPLADITQAIAGTVSVDQVTTPSVRLFSAGTNWPAYSSPDTEEIHNIIDAINAAKSGAPVAAGGIKRCPFCAEEVQAAAIVCKHCGRNIDPAVIKSEKQTAKLNEIGKVGGAVGQVGFTLLALGLIILALFLLWPVISSLLLAR